MLREFCLPPAVNRGAGEVSNSVGQVVYDDLKIVIWVNIRSLIKKIIFYIEALDLR
eukprot:SAG22_NODE_10868_length_512_cov_2.184019_1_plen_56_part_00